jgi:hypothetical protein
VSARVPDSDDCPCALTPTRIEEVADRLVAAVTEYMENAFVARYRARLDFLNMPVDETRVH